MAKIFWIDADVLMQAENGLYSQELAAPFWAFLDEKAEAGLFRSSMRVYKEILQKEDSKDPLAKWVKIRKTSGLFVDPAHHKDVQDKCREINDWVVKRYAPSSVLNPKYPKQHAKKVQAQQAKVAEFLSGADTWTIAHAVCSGGIVVSHENRVDRSSPIPKIPNVCTAFGVECIALREMLSRLGFRFK